MGLLSKLLGGQKNEKAAVDFLKGLVNEVKEKAADELSQDRREERSMPENVEYFNKVFREEFPSYRIEHAPAPKGRRATIFTFYNAQGKALVVELMSENSVARKLRQECAAENIPYLRFYYDHQGWWNTRSYVVRRTLAALRG